MIIDPIYTPRETDLVRGYVPIRSLFDQRTTAAAAQIIFTTSEVSKEHAWIISNYYVRASPGAAQNIVGVTFMIIDEQANLVLRMEQTSGAVVGVEQIFARSSELYILPGERVRFQADFNAAVAANIAVMSLHGFKVPFANFQRGSFT